jgi:hypothetical protein
MVKAYQDGEGYECGGQDQALHTSVGRIITDGRAEFLNPVRLEI